MAWEETLEETNIGTWAVCAAEQRGNLHQRDQERAILSASWVCGHEVFMSVSLKRIMYHVNAVRTKIVCAV